MRLRLKLKSVIADLTAAFLDKGIDVGLCLFEKLKKMFRLFTDVNKQNIWARFPSGKFFCSILPIKKRKINEKSSRLEGSHMLWDTFK